MASWQIPVRIGSRFFIKRRFTVGVVVTSIPFLGYFLLFASSQSGRSPNIVCDCPVATRRQTRNNTVKPQAEAVVTSTAGTSTRKRQKVESIINSSTSTGSLNAHRWSDLCGMDVDILRNWPHFPYFPDERSFISEFHKTQVVNMRNNGERIFGFVHPQTSGKYKFAITSDDTSELWLSPNEDPASSEMIARVYSSDQSAWTKEGDYKKYPDQISKEIILNADKKYYIESLSKQGFGAAHVAVYWSYSNSSFEIISSKYLSNFSEKNYHESIPSHAGKQGSNTFSSKINLYYFNRLSFVSRKVYTSFIPTCPYSPSFLVHRELQRYQGVSLTQESQVFPQDDTDMIINSSWKHDWKKPNALANKNRIGSIVDKLINSLRSR